MKAIINGKSYNTDTATLIMSKDAYDCNGTYAGSNDLMITKHQKGLLFDAQNSNGQNCYRDNYISALSKKDAIEFIDGQLLTDKEEALIYKYLL
ncbi:MAG: hypothetical protein V3R78_12585 [Thermodesulfobacteriota bacterium]